MVLAFSYIYNINNNMQLLSEYYYIKYLNRIYLF